MPIKKGSDACKAKGDIGLIGLAVMGENLILNMANHGFTVCCYNRTTSKVHFHYIIPVHNSIPRVSSSHIQLNSGGSVS